MANDRKPPTRRGALPPGDRDRKPRYGADRDSVRPRVGADRERKPRFGADREGARPRLGGGDRDSKPRFSADRDDRPRKPRFGADRDDRPRKPRFGADRDDRPRKPRFGGDRDDARPRFGGDRERKPRFGGDRERKPRFGGDRERKPRFGGDERKPRFGDDERKPRFGGDERKLRFGGDRDRKPRFGADRDDRPRKPRFGGDRDDARPRFGGDRDRKPRFGGRDRDRDRDREEKGKRVRRRGPWQDSAYSVTRPLPDVKPVDRTVARRDVSESAAPSTETATSAGTPPSATPAGGQERLQKILARCGIASRRKAELLILEGAVTVNGRTVTELGSKADPAKDKIKVNGKLIFTEVEPIYLALYKPKGMISALSDPEGRHHLGELLSEVRERVIPVGRLDYNSEGLLLLTNDGETAERIIKARELPKIYMVKVKGHPTEDALKFLNRGIFTPEGVVRVSSFNVEQSLKAKSWIKLEVTEGSRLDLRELLNHRGLLVDRIVRTAIGNVSIQGLEPGQFRFLKRQDFERLLSFAKPS